MIYFQSNELRGHTEKLKEKLNFELKEANDAKMFHKEEKYQGIDLKELMNPPPPP